VRPFNIEAIGTGKARHPAKSIDAVVGETVLALLRHCIREASLESDQLFPVDAQLPQDAATVHAARKIDRLGAAHQHFLGITAAQRAGPAKWVMIDHRDRAPGAADTSRCDLRRGARADNDEIVDVHAFTFDAGACGQGRRR
jgi:hypothetical protein